MERQAYEFIDGDVLGEDACGEIELGSNPFQQELASGEITLVESQSDEEREPILMDRSGRIRDRLSLHDVQVSDNCENSCGTEEQWEFVFSQYNSLLRWLTRIGVPYEDAEDCIHDGIIKSVEKVRPDDELGSKSYLFSAVKHSWISKLRKDKWVAARIGEDEECSSEIKSKLVTGQYDVENSVICREEVEHTINELQNLPELYKKPLSLRIKGMSIRDISKIVHKPTGTVKTHIFKGRVLLRGNRYDSLDSSEQVG